jgi:signal transduction histidine kinase
MSAGHGAEEQDRDRTLRALGERVKELRTLYRVGEILRGDVSDRRSLLQAVVDILPAGFQHADVAEARIQLGDLDVTSGGFSSTRWCLAAPMPAAGGPAGVVEVIYREARPAEAEGPFLSEERDLIDAVAAMVHSSVVREAAQKAAEAERLRTQRLESIGNLAGGIAHDLNNVLAPILMSVALLKEDEQDADRLESLDTIEVCAQRGAALVHQVLTYARGRDDVRAAVDVGGVVHEVARMLRETCPEAVDLVIDVAASLPPVVGDVTQLHQVVMNLATNARDAVGARGTITLRASEADDDHGAAGILIEVSDTGPGIPASVQEQMFDPFFTTKALGHGTGLGLSTVQSVARAHGGRISVSADVGHGASFRVWLPSADAAAVAAVTPQPVSVPAGGNRTVLVVDDEEGIRLMARKTLERHGYRVLGARNGAEAVQMYTQHGQDICVVIMDMAMPVMDGPTAIRLLRLSNPDVKVIASSGLESVGGAAKAIGVGSVLFIPKPYSADALLRAVGNAIGTP